MTFREWLQNLFGTKASMALQNTWSDERPIYSPVSFESMVVHGYRKNTLIFGCISKTANTASQVAMKFYGKDGEEIEDHPAKLLIQSPNPFMTEFDLWSSVIIYQKLAGAAYYEKERSRAGQVVRLWPLRPDWVAPVPNKKTGLGGYRFGPNEYDSKFIPARDVLAFKLWDPLGLFAIWPPVAVAAAPSDVDNEVTDYLKMFMQKGGTPPGLLKTKRKLRDAEAERISQMWGKKYGGKDHWLNPAVLDEDADYQQIGTSFGEMGFEVLDERNEVRICQVLQVPPIIAGTRIGLMQATKANYNEAKTSWWEDDLLPMYENFEDTIINDLLPEFQPPAVPAWDTTKVSALQENTNSLWERANRAGSSGFITVNEFRGLVGMEEIDGQDVFLRTATMTEVPADQDEREIPETVEEDTEIESETVSDEEPDAEVPADEEAGKSHNSIAEYKINAPDNDERRQFEAELVDKMLKYFEKQQAQLIEEANAG